ncbi:NAD(P)H-hydrate dehydratase [Paraflavisolibacter sp. H34]|uniref:NAD(P)H-hydrate dehydratase n=1 Tax=Huijunlia imazamoxiresistens TaxID=3127457 RepID=UPI003018D633
MPNIFTAEQIRAWDAYTIQHEPVTSVDLMERAARQCVSWLAAQGLDNLPATILCGKGNNGGDGLAIARMLHQQGAPVEVYILETGRNGSPDFQANLQRLRRLPVNIRYIQAPEHFPQMPAGGLVIDALFGSGLNQPLRDVAAALVAHLNQSHSLVVSIDVPSGLFIDQSSLGHPIVKAAFTLTFQTYKPALLVAENAPWIGEVQVLDIGLHGAFLQKELARFQLTDEELIKNIYRPRGRFAHKGLYGHALLIGGSHGKIGAAVLAAKACLHAGAGLTTAYLPRCGYTIMQTALPEVMTLTDAGDEWITGAPPDTHKYAAIGLGPGMGTDQATQQAVAQLVQTARQPLVVDADALNCLALQPQLLSHLPPFSILTPHPKEFERLFGPCANDFERLALAQEKARELGVIIVLKGHHTLIAQPGGALFFNSTGNAGMAKGGSGDVLTGILTAFLAQGYAPEWAALLGVYVHGLAGDLAAKALSKEAMTASDISAFLSKVFLLFAKWQKGVLPG